MDEITFEKDHILEGAVTPLLVWYRGAKRDLPWRHTRDPYCILVSEIMLQQTRVEAVKAYYLRFLQQFPTAEALAAAEEGEVLKAWEGLGYYTRARNLHRAAKQIAAQGFPRTLREIRVLPGVGDYTAGAIASIAFDLPCPAVDGNVLRILTRLLADGSNIDDAATKKLFAERLRRVYPQASGEFCQALMELGALVCLPNGAPLCTGCPWEGICLAHATGREAQFPVRAEKRARKIEQLNVFVLEHEGKFALEQRPAQGLLAGLWQFPLRAGGDPAALGEVIAQRRAKHIFTHIEWHMTGYLIRAAACGDDFVWAEAAQIKAHYALPAAFKAFMPWLDRQHISK